MNALSKAIAEQVQTRTPAPVAGEKANIVRNRSTTEQRRALCRWIVANKPNLIGTYFEDARDAFNVHSNTLVEFVGRPQLSASTVKDEMAAEGFRISSGKLVLKREGEQSAEVAPRLAIPTSTGRAVTMFRSSDGGLFDTESAAIERDEIITLRGKIEAHTIAVGTCAENVAMYLIRNFNISAKE